MTSELIERVARALAGPRADELVLAGNPIGEPCEYPRWMLHQLDARAAIRVIAPAVLEQAAEAATSIYCERDWLDRALVANAFAASIRDLKERYSHDQ